MDNLHRSYLNLCKIFGFFMAKSTKTVSKLLIFCNIIFLMLYLVIFYTRWTEFFNTNLQPVNNVVFILQAANYMITLLSNLISSLLYSKSFLRCLQNLTFLDKHLAEFGLCLNSKIMTKHFYVSLIVAVVLFLYVAVVDFIINSVHLTFSSCLSFYIPLLVNYFSSYLISVSLYFLYARYCLLKKILKNILKSCSVTNDNTVHHLASVGRFVDEFITLNRISKRMMSLFSLRICAIYLLAFFITTSHLYLVIRGTYATPQKVVWFNLMGTHLTEMFLIIFGHYQINCKVSVSV
jgi:hypothetical protein